MSELDVVRIEYEYIPVIKGNVDTRSADELDKLFTINEDNNVIYICRPGKIFSYLISNKDTGEVICVDWDNIDSLMMLNSRAYNRYSIIDQRYSLGNVGREYIERQSSIMRQINKGNSDYVYSFAIVEEVYDKFKPKSYFVRGIICVDKDGYQMAFNPQFIASMEEKKNNQKVRRFIDDCKNKGFI